MTRRTEQWVLYIAVTLPVLGILLSLTPSRAGAQVEEMVVRVVEASPEPGVLQTVGQGEVVYAESQNPLLRAAVIEEALQVSKELTIPKGTAFRSVGNGEYCFTYDIDKPKAVCLASSEGTFTRTRLLKTGSKPTAWSSLSTPIRFTPSHLPLPPLPPNAASIGNVSIKRSRQEILFSGAAGGVLRMQYREFVNDLARPAFSQELTYDLPADAPITVSVKGARIEVLKAGNEGIRHRVQNGFQAVQTP